MIPAIRHQRFRLQQFPIWMRCRGIFNRGCASCGISILCRRHACHYSASDEFFSWIREPSAAPKSKRVLIGGVYSGMKGLSIIIAAFILVFGTFASRGANLDRISAQTGIPVATLQAERASTGLGWGELENAHLLANASGQSFDSLVALHQAGEGWGKIAHDNGLNLGRIVSAAHRSSQATAHAQNLSTVHGKSTAVHGRSTTVHGKSATNVSRGHTSKMTTTRGVAHGSSFRSGFRGTHRMGSMSHFGSFSGSRGMGSMGHGGHGHGR